MCGCLRACVCVALRAMFVSVCVFCVCIRICKIDINSDQMNIIYKDSILLDMYGRTIDIVRSVTKTELHKIHGQAELHKINSQRLPEITIVANTLPNTHTHIIYAEPYTTSTHA